MSLRLILGPMNSEKTTELIRLYRRQRAGKHEVVAVKAIIDDRYGTDNAIQSHNGDTIFSHRVHLLAELDKEELQKAHSIMIDEGQFLADLKEFVTYWLAQGKHITIAALNGDFRKGEWPVIQSLIPEAEYIEKYNAVCADCGSEEGTFTVKLDSNTSTAIIDPGGADKFKSVCRKCRK